MPACQSEGPTAPELTYLAIRMTWLNSPATSALDTDTRMKRGLPLAFLSSRVGPGREVLRQLQAFRLSVFAGAVSCSAGWPYQQFAIEWLKPMQLCDALGDDDAMMMLILIKRTMIIMMKQGIPPRNARRLLLMPIVWRHGSLGLLWVSYPI